MKKNWVTVIILSTLVPCWSYQDDEIEQVSMAEIQSCRGCALNKLPDVKAFIYEDVPHYPNVIFKPIPGAPPELVLYNNLHQEFRRLPLREKSREECNMLLKQYGFSSELDDVTKTARRRGQDNEL